MFLEPLAALFIDWRTELGPSRIAFVARDENQSSTPSLSSRTVRATHYSSGQALRGLPLFIS